jgi:hypothetical protein
LSEMFVPQLHIYTPILPFMTSFYFIHHESVSFFNKNLLPDTLLSIIIILIPAILSIKYMSYGKHFNQCFNE